SGGEDVVVAADADVFRTAKSVAVRHKSKRRSASTPKGRNVLQLRRLPPRKSRVTSAPLRSGHLRPTGRSCFPESLFPSISHARISRRRELKPNPGRSRLPGRPRNTPSNLRSFLPAPWSCLENRFRSTADKRRRRDRLRPSPRLT